MSLYNHSALPDSEFRTIEVNTLALNIIQDSTSRAGDSMVEISLSSLLFGEHLWHSVLYLRSSQKHRRFDGAIPHGNILSRVRNGPV